MIRREKAARIVRILNRLFPMPAIPLRHSDPFSLLAAVVLSAQTTDRKVNQVTPDLFARASSPQEMAAMQPEEICRIIRTIGLAPSKAKNLQALSQALLERHSGTVPQDFEELEALPGVGHKTASVVMAQAFGVPAFPVDTHIHRLAARWGLSNGTTVRRTEEDLKRVFDKSLWIDLHLQMIYFGREYCPARGHDLARCLICSWAASKRRIREEAAKRRTARRLRARA